MIYHKFSIPIYGWKVLFIRSESKDDADECKRISDKFGLEKDLLKDELSSISNGSIDGGLCAENVENKKTLILINPPINTIGLIKTIGHEGRHLVDGILRHLCIKDDEAAAYLTGYVNQQLYKDFKL